MKCGYTIVDGNVEGYPCQRSGDLIENLREAITLGANSVEIHLSEPEELDCEKLNEMLKGKLEISALGTGLSCGKYGLSLTSTDTDVYNKTVNKLKAYIDAAKALSCGVILGSVRGKNPDHLPKEVYEETYLTNLAPIVTYAEQQGVVLFMETINRYELQFYNKAEDMARLVRIIGSPNVKVHIDTFHMNIEEENIYESVVALKDVLGHVHMADNTRKEPGTGSFDFKSLAKALHEINYQGNISMECFNPAGTSKSIEDGLAYMKTL